MGKCIDEITFPTLQKTMNFEVINDWSKVICGDIGFYAGSSLFEKAIEDLEPGRPLVTDPDFKPSHVFMVWDRDHVVEAIETNAVNSQASLDDAGLYRFSEGMGRVRLVRPVTITNMDKHDSLMWLINNFGQRRYPVWNLVGFAIEKVTGYNPFFWGDVCSQSAVEYLNHADPRVVQGLQQRNTDPLNLYTFCMEGK